MSTPPKRHTFGCLKSHKIKEKWSLKTNLKKNTKKWDHVTFSCNFDPQKCHKGGGSWNSLFLPFLSFGPFWAPLVSKWCQGSHHDTILFSFGVPFDAKFIKKCDLEWEKTPNIITKTSERFWKSASVSFGFSLYLNWFCVWCPELRTVAGRPKASG